jgi:hypothetical protein
MQEQDYRTFSSDKEGTTQNSIASAATGTSVSDQKSTKIILTPFALQTLLASIDSPVYLGKRPAEGGFTTEFSCKGPFTFFAKDMVLVCPNTKDGTKPDGSIYELPPKAETDCEFNGWPTFIVRKGLIGFEKSKHYGDRWKRIPPLIYPPGQVVESVDWQEVDVVKLEHPSDGE